jgi:3-isopropylmalate dehydratase small subunit
MKILFLSTVLFVVSNSFGQQLQRNSREFKLEPVTVSSENTIELDEETETSSAKISKEKRRKKVKGEIPAVINNSEPSSSKKNKP